MTIVTPCFNAADDLRTLYADLGDLVLTLSDGTRIDADLIVIDNASSEPLAAIPTPDNWNVDVVRLRSNTGGSGGYNAGMALAIRKGRESGEMPEFLWLLDSDARPEAGALRGLLEAIDTDSGFVIMGSAIARPEDGSVFEVGGRIERVFGQFGPQFGEEKPAPREIVEVGYTAACSALVRADAVERVGLFPDVFLNGDDVEWCYRLARESGGKVGATQASRVRHPYWVTAGVTRRRYIVARNAFGPIDALGLGWRVRMCRALREVPKALAQVMIGREDLAELHLRGLEDAADGRLLGPGAMFELPVEPFVPLERAGEVLGAYEPELSRGRTFVHPRVRLDEANAERLESALRAIGIEIEPIPRGAYPIEREWIISGVVGGLWRLVRGPTRAVAVIPVRGRPNAWCRGRIQVQVTPDALIVTRCQRGRMLRGVLRTTWRGIRLSWRLARRKPARSARERLPQVADYRIDCEPPA